MKLSVIIQNYNYGRFLHESLGSLLNQRYTDYEVIYLDDKSTDNSMEIVREYGKQYGSKLKIYENEKNMGVCFTMQRGISLATGEYLGSFASDDKWEPNFLSEVMNYLEKYPDLVMCSTNSAFFDSKSQTVKSYGNNFEYLDVDKSLKKFKTSPFLIFSPGTIYKRNVYQSIKWDPSIGFLCDWYLNCRLASAHPIAYLPKTLGWMRLEGPRFSTISASNKKAREKSCKVAFEYLNQDPAFKKFAKKSGLLGTTGRWMYFYILKHPEHWHYLPMMVYRKLMCFFNKPQKETCLTT